MRTTVYLVRHAEAQSNINPFLAHEQNDLTKLGVNQSRQLAAYFKGKRIKNIFSSPILRAQLTAEEVGKVLNVKPAVLDFTEERSVSYKNDSSYEHKESFEKFKLRLEVAREYFENLPEGHVIFVGHAIFIKAFVSYIVTGCLFTEELSDQISDTLIIDNTSVSKCIFNKDKASWRIDSLNDKAHLVG